MISAQGHVGQEFCVRSGEQQQYLPSWSSSTTSRAISSAKRRSSRAESAASETREDRTVGTPSLGCTRCLSSLAFSDFHARRDGHSSRMFFCRFNESFVVVVTAENGWRRGGGCPF